MFVNKMKRFQSSFVSQTLKPAPNINIDETIDVIETFRDDIDMSQLSILMLF